MARAAMAKVAALVFLSSLLSVGSPFLPWMALPVDGLDAMTSRTSVRRFPQSALQVVVVRAP